MKLCNEELHDFCSSPNITELIKSRRMTWAGHGARMTEIKRKISVGYFSWKRQLGRCKCRWEDNIKTGDNEIGF
jgi:hypothetical protein